MTPTAILAYARTHGITLMADGDRLVIRSDDDLPAELVEAAREHKLELLASLSGPSLSDSVSDDIREHLEERAAIQEHDGGLSRPEAEREARGNLRVFKYWLTDDPSAELVFISPGSTLDDARRRLEYRFGADRVIDVMERKT